MRVVFVKTIPFPSVSWLQEKNKTRGKILNIKATIYYLFSKDCENEFQHKILNKTSVEIPCKLFPAFVTSGDDVFRELLVLWLAVKCKLVRRLPVRHLVDLEPLHCCLGGEIRFVLIAYKYSP